MKGEVRQDMFKRFLAAALSALLFLQALPLEALADGERFLISEAELEAAVALSGLDEDAAGWHDGMTPSENMNAAQIAGYLERLIEHDLKGLMDTAQDVEKALADLLLSDPQRYAELTSGNGSLAQLDSLTANLRAMMDDLSYDHDELVAQSDYIYTNRNAPFNAEYSEKERIQYGRSIREASETIRAIIPAVVQHYPSWEQSLAEWRAAGRRHDGAPCLRQRSVPADHAAAAALSRTGKDPFPGCTGHSRPGLHPHAAAVRRYGRARHEDHRA